MGNWWMSSALAKYESVNGVQEQAFWKWQK
jgi:hypothetical protein